MGSMYVNDHHNSAGPLIGGLPLPFDGLMATAAFDFFAEVYGAKFDRAVACLTKDRDRLLTFYGFPAEHWRHLRYTNRIENTVATVRLRTCKT